MYNEKCKNGLQKQGTYVHSTSDLDPATNVADIRDDAMGFPFQVATAKIIKKAHMHVSNVPGTDAYWTSSRFEMKAAIFYPYYIEENITFIHRVFSRIL